MKSPLKSGAKPLPEWPQGTKKDRVKPGYRLSPLYYSLSANTRTVDVFRCSACARRVMRPGRMECPKDKRYCGPKCTAVGQKEASLRWIRGQGGMGE